VGSGKVRDRGIEGKKEIKREIDRDKGW